MTTVLPARRPPLAHGQRLPVIGGPLAGESRPAVLVWGVPQPLFVAGEFDVYDLDRMKRRWVWRREPREGTHEKRS